MLVFIYFMHGLLGNFMVNILPCGKRLHNYGKSPFLMGKSSNYKSPCSIAMLVYQRVCWLIIIQYHSPMDKPTLCSVGR